MSLNRQNLARQGRIFRVEGWSMWPTYKPQAVFEVETVSLQDLNVGDVIVVHSGNGFYVHRLLAFSSLGYLRTAGDMRLFPDPLIPLSQVIGRVKPFGTGSISLLNKIMSWVTLNRFRFMGLSRLDSIK